MLEILCAALLCFGPAAATVFALAPSTPFSSQTPEPGERAIDEKRFYEDILKHVNSSTSRGPLIIGIGGASGVGKTTFARTLKEKVEEKGFRAQIIPLDAFIESPAERARLADLGNAWGPEHMRLREMRRVLDLVRGNARNVETERYERQPSPHLEQWSIIPQQGVQVVILEGVWAISSEDRLGNAWEFVDIPIYLESNLADIESWRWQGEQTRTGTPKTAEEFRRHWRSGILPDFENNIRPSKSNAAYVVRFDSSHAPLFFMRSIADAADAPGLRPETAWRQLVGSFSPLKEFFLSRDIRRGDKVLHVGPGLDQNRVAAEALLGGDVTVVDRDPDIKFFHDAAPMLRRYPAIRQAGGNVAFLQADVSRLGGEIQKGALSPHSFDHVTMMYVSPYWTNTRLMERYGTQDVAWDNVADGLLALLKKDGGTMLVSWNELSELTAQLHKRAIPFRVMEMGFDAIAVDSPIYLLVLGKNPLGRLTPYAKRKYAEFLIKEWRHARGRPATPRPVLGHWLPGGVQANAAGLAEKEVIELFRAYPSVFSDDALGDLSVMLRVHLTPKMAAPAALPGGTPAMDASL